MKEWAKSFYKSKAWQDCREAFIISKHGLCERCGGPGKIVHHKVYLTPQNINDPNVTLNWENLELVCLLCHNSEHYNPTVLTVPKSKATRKGLRFNEWGELVQANVFIVWGPPASGKTTYVKNHMKEGDLVVDLDLIKQAISLKGKTETSDNLLDIAMSIRELLYELIEKRNIDVENAWVIASLPGKKEREELAKRLKGELIEMKCDKKECIRRALEDMERKDKELQIAIIDKWFKRYEQ